ncbi:pp38 protein [Gallid alphaherpesvirus 3]|uniref:Homolog of pp38 n=3 Tax=Mardivirus TaxID=180252 RepID=Q69324_9ALPH|nr:protein pp38 [Gallid alphaherpesvirus 3]BAA05661.1 homolog of pp38 [Gallid alphaherpesvirus 2]BAA82955.1 homolog of MDV1 pp38 [Marek's disease virus serotype 2 MDV2]BAB16570.1 pp38 protein [Gallid alphaherpesvirus 3]
MRRGKRRRSDGRDRDPTADPRAPPDAERDAERESGAGDGGGDPDAGENDAGGRGPGADPGDDPGDDPGADADEAHARLLRRAERAVQDARRLLRAESEIVQSINLLMIAEKGAGKVQQNLVGQRLAPTVPRTVLSVESENATMRSLMVITLIRSARSLVMGSCMAFFAGILIGRAVKVDSTGWQRAGLFMALCTGAIAGGIWGRAIDSKEENTDANDPDAA